MAMGRFMSGNSELIRRETLGTIWRKKPLMDIYSSTIEEHGMYVGKPLKSLDAEEGIDTPWWKLTQEDLATVAARRRKSGENEEDEEAEEDEEEDEEGE